MVTAIIEILLPALNSTRDEICLEARAALLLEANCASERIPAFVRNTVKSFTDKTYQLPEAITIQHEIDSYNGTMAYLTCLNGSNLPDISSAENYLPCKV